VFWQFDMLINQNYDQYAYLDKDRRSEYHMQKKNDDVGKGCLIKE